MLLIEIFLWGRIELNKNMFFLIRWSINSFWDCLVSIWFEESSTYIIYFLLIKLCVENNLYLEAFANILNNGCSAQRMHQRVECVERFCCEPYSNRVMRSAKANGRIKRKALWPGWNRSTGSPRTNKQAASERTNGRTQSNFQSTAIDSGRRDFAH